MAVDSSQFNAEAQKILQELQKLLDKDDEAIFKNLPGICKEFINFYDNYYEQGERTSKGLVAHKKQLQNLINLN